MKSLTDVLTCTSEFCCRDQSSACLSDKSKDEVWNDLVCLEGTTAGIPQMIYVDVESTGLESALDETDGLWGLRFVDDRDPSEFVQRVLESEKPIDLDANDVDVEIGNALDDGHLQEVAWSSSWSYSKGSVEDLWFDESMHLSSESLDKLRLNLSNPAKASASAKPPVSLHAKKPSIATLDTILSTETTVGSLGSEN